MSRGAARMPYDATGSVEFKPMRRVVRRRTLLVAGQHPDLDARQQQVGDGVGHAVLQLVLDGRGAQQRQVLLDFLEHLVQLSVAVHYRRAVQFIPRSHVR